MRAALCFNSSARESNALLADATSRPSTSAARVAINPIATITMLRVSSPT